MQVSEDLQHRGGEIKAADVAHGSIRVGQSSRFTVR
jgi:hypothetical protein